MIKKYPVKISNELIRSRKPIGDREEILLSTLEYKIVILLISLIKPTDIELKFHTFSISDFFKFWNISMGGKQKDSIIAALDNLCNRQFIVENKTVKWLDSDSKIINGKMYLKIDDSLLNYLINLKNNFTTIDINNILYLKSKFSINMYFYLKTLESQKHYNIKLETAYKKFADDKYTTKSEFDRNVISKAINEINQKTDINITKKYVNDFGYPEMIRFFITSKKLQSNILSPKRKKNVLDIFVDDYDNDVQTTCFSNISLPNENELPF